MQQISITLLRGVHTTPHAPTVARMVKDADVILIEGPMLITAAQRCEAIYNAISNDPAYVKSLSKIINEPAARNFSLQLVWRLRGSGKLFGMVDLLVDDSEADKLKSVFFAQTFIEAMHAVAQQPARRYDIIDKAVDVNVRSIHERNTIVVGQIERVVAKLKKHERAIKIAVVQGYSHRIEAELRQRLHDPSVTIHSAVFDPEAVEHVLQQNPTAALIAQKLKRPQSPLSHKQIDYALYWLLSMSNQLEDGTSLGDKTYRDLSIDMQSVGESHAAFQHVLKNSEKVGPIEKYTEQELAQQVEALLSR